MSSFNLLPPEIQFQILTLPVDLPTLRSIRLVNRQWSSLVTEYLQEISSPPNQSAEISAKFILLFSQLQRVGYRIRVNHLDELIYLAKSSHLREASFNLKPITWNASDFHCYTDARELYSRLVGDHFDEISLIHPPYPLITLMGYFNASLAKLVPYFLYFKEENWPMGQFDYQFGLSSKEYSEASVIITDNSLKYTYHNSTVIANILELLPKNSLQYYQGNLNYFSVEVLVKFQRLRTIRVVESVISSTCDLSRFREIPSLKAFEFTWKSLQNLRRISYELLDQLEVIRLVDVIPSEKVRDYEVFLKLYLNDLGDSTYPRITTFDLPMPTEDLAVKFQRRFPNATMSS